MVDTIGGKRFRVLSRGMKDGYSIADIEHLEDTRVRPPPGSSVGSRRAGFGQSLVAFLLQLPAKKKKKSSDISENIG